MNKSKGILFSFLLGGAIGGAIALLYAPMSGKHFRNDISRKTNDFIEEGKKKTYDTWNGAKEKVESSMESANDLLNTGKEKFDRKVEKVKYAFKAGIYSYYDTKDDCDPAFEDEGITYNHIT